MNAKASCKAKKIIEEKLKPKNFILRHFFQYVASVLGLNKPKQVAFLSQIVV
jgi:hypothetical protein